MRKQFKRKSCILIAMLLIATMLNACSSAKTDEAAPKQETQQTEVAEQEVQDAEVKEEPVEEESVAEPELEIESEPEIEEVLDTIPEGVDLESDLPGAEWIATFRGVVDEPLFVVFNDETNKKVVALDGQSIQYEKGDSFVVFAPEGSWSPSHSGMVILKTLVMGDHYNQYIFDEDCLKAKQDLLVEIKKGSDIRLITCTVECK